MDDREDAVDASPAAALVGHVIVCGLQGVGLRTVEQLRQAGVSVVVVEDEPDDRLDRMVAAWGVPLVVGSARVGATLERAGLAGARAVVCAERTELQTLETALLISELRPELRVVVQLANEAVGTAVSRVTGPGTVLDAASIAAPSIAEACLGTTAHRVELGGTSFGIVETEVTGRGTLRSLYGDLAPMAVVPTATGETVVCPGRDHRVHPGDRVTVFGTPAELAAAGVARDERPTDRHRRRGPAVGRVRQMIGLVSSDTNRSLRIALELAVIMGIVSTLVLRFFYRVPGGGHLSLLRSLYFTVETVSAVGFGDFSFSDQSVPMVVFGILLIVFGVAMLTTVFALLTNLLVSWRIEQSLGQLQATGMEGHVVVVGLGSIGVRVLEELVARGTPAVVVERSESNRYVPRARALGVPVLVADATQRQTLEAAGVASASAVAVLTSDDLANIETALAVRDVLADRWTEVPVVLRVFDRDLGRTVRHHFGFDHVQSTSALAAPRFVGAALGCDILGSFSVGDQPFLIGRLTVVPGRGLDGLAMVDLPARTRVVAIGRAGDAAGLEHPPRRDTRFAPGDQAYVVGPYEELLRLLRHQHEDDDAGEAVRPGR